MPRGYFNPAIDLNLGPLRRLLEDLRLGWDLSDQSIPPTDLGVTPPSPPDVTAIPQSATPPDPEKEQALKTAAEIIKEGIMEGFTMPRQEAGGVGGVPLTAEKIAKIRAQAASPKFQEQMNVNAMQPARPIGGGAFPVSPASSGNPVIDQAAGLARGGPTRGIFDYTGPRPIAAPGGGYTGPRQVMAGGAAIPVGAASSAPPARGEYSIPAEERFTPEQANMLNSLQPWATATTASQIAGQPKLFPYDTESGAGVASFDPMSGQMTGAQMIPGATPSHYGAVASRRDAQWQAAAILGLTGKDPATWTPEERMKLEELTIRLMTSRAPNFVGLSAGGYGAPPEREPNRVGAGQTDIFGR